jgi:hypothetical protein
VHELLVHVSGDGLAVLALGEEGHDGRAAVSADDGDGRVGGRRVGDPGEEAGGADDIEGGDAEDVAGFVGAQALESRGDDGDGGVDGVGDDADKGIGCNACYGRCEVADDGCVCLWDWEKRF